MVVLVSAFALASDWRADPGLGVRVTGEALTDENIVEDYGPSTVAGEIVATLPLPRGLEAGFQLGYGRFAGQETAAATWLWYAPISATIGVHKSFRSVDLYADIGPSYLLWGDKPSGGEYKNSGGRIGILTEVGTRIHTNWVLPSLHAPEEGIRGVDAVLGVGYRWSNRGSQEGCTLTDGCNLSFSALRLSAGLVARF